MVEGVQQGPVLVGTFLTTGEDSPSHEAPPSEVANPPEAVEASLTYEPSAMNPNGDHNPPVSQPQVNAIWHPAILPP